MITRCFAIFLVVSFLSGNTLVPSVFADTEEEDLRHQPQKVVPEKKEIQELEKLRGDFTGWLNVQKEKGSHQFQNILELKLFQTNVFFGSAMAFFAVLVVLFVLKFIFNIVGDSIKAVYEKLLLMMGRDTATVGEHHFAPVMKEGSAGKTITTSGNSKTGGNNRSAPAKKKFLFCEVMSQFVNPLIKPETVQKALTDQNARNPKPRIGALLMESQAVSQEEVDKTLRLQKQFRAQK